MDEYEIAHLYIDTYLFNKVETGYHYKNGAVPKSLMSRKN